MDTSYLDRVLTTSDAWLWGLIVLVGAALVGLLVHALLIRIARRVFGEPSEDVPLLGALLRRLPRPLRVLIPTLFAYGVFPLIRSAFLPTVAMVLDGGLFILLVGATTWLVIAAFTAGEEAVASHYAIDVSDNLRARKIVTQVRILRRIATAVIIVLAVSLVLLQYDPFRELGTGILASAGIVGIVVGVAAQQTLGNVLAGIQIALTQPIRVDDVVIAEGEFGWVEEITLTYVVVRVWDRRRIVLPIKHFVEKPFQNWTRTSSDLIGAVFLRVDHRTPVGAVREEFYRIVEASDDWDGDVRALQVTDAGEWGIELRALASAENAPRLWDLRCEIREALVAFLRDQHPEALPLVRARLQPEGDGFASVASEEDPRE